MRVPEDMTLREVPTDPLQFGAPSRRGGSSPWAASTPTGTGDFMEINLESDVIEKLSFKGILAYVAVRLADGTEATTAKLASSVKTRSTVIAEGIHELEVSFPEMVVKHKNKWKCGVVNAGEGTIAGNARIGRYVEFVDDLKRCWDFLNPNLPFSMGARDGIQIRNFLSSHPEWGNQEWGIALRNRIISVIKHGNDTRSAPLWEWVPRLDKYAAGPLDRFGRPVEGNNGKTDEIRNRNREAVARAIANS